MRRTQLPVFTPHLYMCFLLVTLNLRLEMSVWVTTVLGSEALCTKAIESKMNFFFLPSKSLNSIHVVGCAFSFLGTVDSF